MSRLLVGAFDGTSRIPGVALGAMRLLTAFRTAAHQVTTEGHVPASAAAIHELETPRIVRETTKNSAMWCRKLRAVAEQSTCKLLLGGEHLVTFPLLEVMKARHPGLRLVVLDAHHDAYPHPLLTHWSLFHFAVRELGIPTLVLGARHELEKADSACEIVTAGELREMGPNGAAKRIAAFAGDAPLYFSVDIDVLDPDAMPCVSDPVPGGISIDELVETVRAVLAHGPVAADLVEYNGVSDRDGAAVAALAPVLKEYARWFL